MNLIVKQYANNMIKARAYYPLSWHNSGVPLSLIGQSKFYSNLKINHFNCSKSLINDTGSTFNQAISALTYDRTILVVKKHNFDI